MALFKWSTIYSVGQTDIDEQHQGLIETMNALAELVEQGAAPQQQLSTLDKLYQLTQAHFSHEEGRMQGARFPDLVAHQALHTKLLGQLQGIRDDVAKGTSLNASHLNFFKTWLAGHIIGSDKKYSPYLASAPPATP